MTKSKLTREQANTSLEARLFVLQDRARMLREARSFFFERTILEVDCPALTHFSSVDAHIDPMRVFSSNDLKGYLHTSPEYGMKRLLAEGIGDIYQLSHVFRQEEKGKVHNPEFTMVEWYRMGISFEALIEETIQFIFLFLGQQPCLKIPFRQFFFTTIQVEYRDAQKEDFLRWAKKEKREISKEAESWDKDTWLDFFISFACEAHLPCDTLCILYDFPATTTQSALAKVEKSNGEEVSRRFEAYYGGIELANGYQELTNPQEQRERLFLNNALRIKQGKDPLPIDEHFLEALQRGIEECCGVAVGFDRLLMLRNKKNRIHEVLPFSWENA